MNIIKVTFNYQVFILALVNMLYLFQAPPQTAGQVLQAHSSGFGVTPHQPASGSAHPKPRQVPQVGWVPCPGLVTYPVNFELF